MFDKTELLPFVYANTDLAMVQESDYKVNDILFTLSKSEYKRLKKFNYRIGGMLYKQWAAWRLAGEYKRQMKTGKGIGGAMSSVLSGGWNLTNTN